MTSAQLPNSRPFFGNAALITRAQAEHILAAVDAGNPKTKKPRVREPDTFILSGLLFTPREFSGTATRTTTALVQAPKGDA